MKILKIEFENINSLKGFHEIDFSEEPFLTNSLFAITGATGSGKSSILDVICLALFGKIPRIPGNRPISKTDIEKFGTILTRNQKESLARVTYRCNYGDFTSQWSISTNRNNKLRDNEMEICLTETGEIVTSQKSEVPGKNEELIGLNYDQFIKAVLLCQGEFAQFLKAKKEERGELLEKITGTGIYRRLGMKAFEKNKAANREIQEQQSEMQVIQRDLLEDEVLTSHNKDLEEKTRTCDRWQKEIDAIKKALSIKDDIQNLEQQLEKVKSAEEQTFLQLKKFDSEHGAPLKQHEKVQAEADNLRNWNRLRKIIQESRLAKEGIRKNIAANELQKKELLKKASGLIRQEADEENILQQLNDFRDKVQELQETRNSKLNSYSLKKDQLRSELRDTDIPIDENNPEKFLAGLNIQAEAAKSEIERYGKELEIEFTTDLQDEQQRLRSRLKRSREALREFSLLDAEKKEILRINQELENSDTRFIALPKQIEEHSKKLKEITKSLENSKLKKENMLLRASLEEHRKNLRDGEPCPLCGATDHPYANEDAVETTALDIKIAELTSKHEKAHGELHQLQADHRSLEKIRKEKTEQLQRLQQDNTNGLKKFADNYSDFSQVASKDELEKLSERLELKIEKLGQVEKLQQRSKAISNSIPLTKELQEIVQDGKELKQELDRLYSGKNIQNDVQQISNSWIQAGQERKGCLQRKVEISEALKKTSEEIEKLEDKLRSFASSAGFRSIEAAWEALMPEADALRLRNEKQQISDKINQNKASGKTLSSQLEKLRGLDSESEKEQLNAQLQQKTEQHTVLSKECKEIERILKNQQERLERMKNLKEEIEEKEKQTRRWRLLNELIGDSKGKAFNDFAQDLTLRQLLKLANKRLKDLNDRYLIDKPEPEEDDGLVAIDEHMGGQRRSVKTLSGGETFILSLSMALALSDLASRNVEINSLFIDEGFGTLDPETLDQTLDTLEKLQAESSKTIGIISHVDSLKERISTQIQLSRNAQGYSSLKIRPEK